MAGMPKIDDIDVISPHLGVKMTKMGSIPPEGVDFIDFWKFLKNPSGNSNINWGDFSISRGVPRGFLKKS